MYTCEAMERDKLKLANQYFTHLATKQTDAIDAIVGCCRLDEPLLKKLIGKFMHMMCGFFYLWLEMYFNLLIYLFYHLSFFN